MAAGITGLWQRFRRRGKYSQRDRHDAPDVDYLAQLQLWLIAKYMLATLPAVLWGTGRV